MVCSNFWKLDKIDKIVISLIFILFTIFSVFSCFCFAETPVDYVFLENVGGNWNDMVLQKADGRNGIYFIVQPGHTYNIKISNVNVNGLNYTYTSEVPAVGVSCLTPFKSTAINDLNITVPDDVSYLYFYGYNNQFVITDESSVEITDVTRVGFASVIDSLFLNVGLSQLWNIFETSIPWVLVVVLFVFGWWFFSHWVKELSKGREF